MLRFMISFALIAIAGTAALARADAMPARPHAVSADEVVALSIASPYQPLPQTWVWMDVCGAGADEGSGFLNSFEDYRDRRSLNVELPIAVRLALAGRLGGDPVEQLRGQRIRVYGSARQVRINLLRNGRATGRYYFQTQLRVEDAAHLEVMAVGPDDPAPGCVSLIS